MAHRIPEDKAREDRIIFDIVVDAYDDTERAMGWYYYLQDELRTPFATVWLLALNITAANRRHR